METNSRKIMEDILSSNPDITREFVEVLYECVATRYDEEHSYAKYIEQLRNDDKFQKFIQSITYDSLRSKE